MGQKSKFIPHFKLAAIAGSVNSKTPEKAGSKRTKTGKVRLDRDRGGSADR